MAEWQGLPFGLEANLPSAFVVLRAGDIGATYLGLTHSGSDCSQRSDSETSDLCRWSFFAIWLMK